MVELDEAQEHLRQYIVARMRDNVLSLADLVNISLGGKLLKTLSTDVRAVLKVFGRIGLKNIGARLMQMAEDVVPSSKKR